MLQYFVPFFLQEIVVHIDKFKETNLSTASETNETKIPVKRLRDGVINVDGKTRFQRAHASAPDVHLNQSSHVIFVFVCVVFVFSWKKHWMSRSDAWIQYSNVYVRVISVSLRKTSCPSDWFWEKNVFFLRQYDLSVCIFFYSNIVHWSQRTAQGGK